MNQENSKNWVSLLRVDQLLGADQLSRITENTLIESFFFFQMKKRKNGWKQEIMCKNSPRKVFQPAIGCAQHQKLVEIHNITSRC